MGRVLFKTFACGAAGLLVWICCEPFFPHTLSSASLTAADPAFAQVEFIYVLLLGILVGLTSGLVQGYMRGGKRHMLMSAGAGALFGFVGALLGYRIGSWCFEAGMTALRAAGVLEPTMIVRMMGVAPLCLGVGAAIGFSTFTPRGLISGLAGGGMAGVVGGLLFNPICDMMSPMTKSIQGGGVPEVGMPGRAFMAISCGLLVGFFTAVVDQATRQAWVRLVLGKNEGKEWPIDHAETLIGRDERAHVPLFGDMNVASLHAIIRKQGSTYWLQDPGTQVGVGLNGQRIQGQVPLSSGDTIQLASHQLHFFLRHGKAQRVGEGRAMAFPMVGAQPRQPVAPGGYVSSQPDPAQAQVPFQPVPAASQVPTPAPTRMTIVAVTGPMTGQRIDVATTLEAGREGAGLALGFDTMASRRHAALAPQMDGILVTDLGSTNGTFVNGQRIQSMLARVGDTLTIGATTFRVEGLV